jgi:hypothetical protein
MSIEWVTWDVKNGIGNTDPRIKASKSHSEDLELFGAVVTPNLTWCKVSGRPKLEHPLVNT